MFFFFLHQLPLVGVFFGDFVPLAHCALDAERGDADGGGVLPAGAACFLVGFFGGEFASLDVHDAFVVVFDGFVYFLSGVHCGDGGKAAGDPLLALHFVDLSLFVGGGAEGAGVAGGAAGGVAATATGAGATGAGFGTDSGSRGNGALTVGVAVAVASVGHQGSSGSSASTGGKSFVPEVIEGAGFASLDSGSTGSTGKDFAFVTDGLDDFFVRADIAATAEDEAFLLHYATILQVWIVIVGGLHFLVFVFGRIPDFVEMLSSHFHAIEADGKSLIHDGGCAVCLARWGMRPVCISEAESCSVQDRSGMLRLNIQISGRTGSIENRRALEGRQQEC